MDDSGSVISEEKTLAFLEKRSKKEMGMNNVVNGFLSIPFSFLPDLLETCPTGTMLAVVVEELVANPGGCPT